MDEKKESSEQEGGFKVTDRRSFTTEGDEREPSEPAPAGEQEIRPSEPPEAAMQAEKTEDPSQALPGGGEGEQIDFASFVISLATTGMVHMGEIPDPATGTATVNLEGARQMIDILGILKEKTEGNCSPEESHLLDNLLYELRMKFLGKSRTIDL